MARRADPQQPVAGRVSTRSGLARDQVAEIQRVRLLAGALGAVEEYGYTDTTVARITARARVSRRTFYELFANTEACLAALIEDALAQLERELAAADLDNLPWRERVRGGLAVILAFFDCEPALARVCVVQALRAGSPVLERREALLARLARVVDEGRGEGSRAGDCTPLTAEGLVGAAFGILYARLSRGEAPPLLELTGELMGMIVLPYMGPAAARREQGRPVPQAPALAVGRSRSLAAAQPDPLQGLQMRLTYRTAQVLQGISELPGVSNRRVADYAGIHDQGQVSKLLRRLERLGLIANGGAGHSKGEANAWTLTPLGGQVAQHLNVGAGREMSRLATDTRNHNKGAPQP
jgi:AcrR family transcriptional regulator